MNEIYQINGESCVKQSCHCKACRKPIEVFVSSDYAEVGDHLGLLPMATCDRCYDYVTGKTDVVQKIFKVCADLMAARRGKEGDRLREANEKFFGILCGLSKRYARIVSSYYRSNYHWNEEFPKLFMDAPDRAGAALQNYMQTYRREIVDASATMI